MNGSETSTIPRASTRSSLAAAFYLMTHGGLSAHVFEQDDGEKGRISVPCGIGWNNALRMYWNLIAHRLDGSTTFRRALESLEAAKDLDIPTEPVACAWVAVGVLEAKDAEKWAQTQCEMVPTDAPDEPPPDLEITTRDGVRLIETGPVRLICTGTKLAD